MRLSTVVTVRDGGLYDVLLPDFQAQSGYTVRVLAAEDVYEPARSGQADIVLSHYGHKDLDTFVQGGFGAWPRTILFNQVCLIGPVADPAGVGGLADLVVAFQRIAAVKAPFIVNNSEGLQYLSQTIAIDAGLAPTGGLFVNERLKEGAAMQAAAARGGYTVWGLTPFLRYLKDSPLPLRPLVLADPILQRIMVTTVVNPAKVKGVNAPGAAALQDYLLAPATQAKIRAFRLPGIDQPVFWPAGRNNASAVLPDLTGSSPTQSSGAPAHGAGGGGAGGGTGAPSLRP
ncbi:MAG: substrate-binding domain-containing protein [Mycobacteriales bacterium]